MDESQRCFEFLRAGDYDGIRRLLDQTLTAAEFKDACGVSLLMHALYRGQRDLAEIIAGKKQELDIFEASALGRLDRLEKCLSDASAIDSFSKDGFTALHFACYFGQPASARLLIESGAKIDIVANNPTQVMPLHSAASSRNLEAARSLVEHGAPVNARQQAGWAPIHAAAQNGDTDMIKLLLAHAADADIANDDGKTPAMIAREKGHSGIAAALETAKSKPWSQGT
jgi:uncharacterized protein